MNRLAVQVVAGAVVCVFAIGIWITGGDVDPGWLRFFSAAVLVATALLVTWDRYLWRLSLAQRVPGVPRSLRGTWRGTLTSLWVNPETGATPAPKTVYLVVRQSASAVAVTLFSDETTSRSSLARVMEADGTGSLDYVYLDRPSPLVRHRSPIHHGSGSLAISGRPATRMKGRYWTDRGSRGEVDFADREPSLADDYDAAVAMFQ